MFICTIGDHVVPPGIPPKRVVTEIRKRIYSDGSTGWEIVSEENICPEHAVGLEGESHELAGATTHS